MEEKAIPLYVEALKLGLGGSYRIMAVIQLGSSYRNMKRYEESREKLEKAVKESMSDPATVIFLSMTLWSSGKIREAAILAMRHIYNGNHGLVQRYKRSKGNYLDELEHEIGENPEESNRKKKVPETSFTLLLKHVSNTI